MGGTSKGRVSKKQRQSKTRERLTESLASVTSARSMRRGLNRVQRSAPPARHVNLSAIDELFESFRESDGALKLMMHFPV